MRIFQYLIFTIFIPCTIGIYIPVIINEYLPLQINIGNFRYSGLLFIFSGCILYISSSITFLLNKGTPAIWFAKRLKFIIGKEPDILGNKNIYTFSRNPMYMGVFSFIFGVSLYKDSFSVLIYLILIIIIFNIVVKYIEEPHLMKKYGDEYTEYLKNVPRWFKLF